MTMREGVIATNLAKRFLGYINTGVDWDLVGKVFGTYKLDTMITVESVYWWFGTSLYNSGVQ
jgi:hypothetical protein